MRIKFLDGPVKGQQVDVPGTPMALMVGLKEDPSKVFNRGVAHCIDERSYAKNKATFKDDIEVVRYARSNKTTGNFSLAVIR